MTAQPFGTRLKKAMETYGPLCLGLDPHTHLLEAWGLPVTPAGLEKFSMTVLEAIADETAAVAALKPQVAFYEQFGSAGLAVLERVLAEAAGAGVLTIADAKRGDIGSTMAGYARAWLADGSALVADSVTLSPYLGFESLRSAVDLARKHHRGVFVLGLTSNPEGASVQHVGGPGASVAGGIIEATGAENSRYPEDELGSVGLVIGATVADQAKSLGIDLTASKAPLLAPGYGSQGATAQDLRAGFGSAWPQVLVNSSRAILAQGPDVSALRAAVMRSQEDLLTAQPAER